MLEIWLKWIDLAVSLEVSGRKTPWCFPWKADRMGLKMSPQRINFARPVCWAAQLGKCSVSFVPFLTPVSGILEEGSSHVAQVSEVPGTVCLSRILP